ncbi:MAG: class I tRNA ligase family protein, partial [Patescibacteria group bacterium]
MAAEKHQFNLPEFEEKILKFWEEKHIFERTLAKTKKGRPFVFYEGPPTANGSPGIHHVEARAFKDLIPRYKTMRGFYVPRKAGWDTHGLPVEIQVEKELGLKIKQDIETYGIAPFNAKAKESVWRYKEEWDRLTKRMGFWLDLEHPYITYDPFYMESLWWIIKEFWNKKLLVEDFKVLPWCTRCQTGLSTHEMAQGYRVTKDLSVFVKFPISNFQFPNQLRTPNPKVFILSWTTTPWTLPGNVALAINPKLEYLIVADLPRAVEDNESGVVTEVYIFAKDAVGHGIRGDVLSELLPDYGNIVMLEKKSITECSNVIATIKGDKLIGL